jgi:hypothetical protein
MRAMSQVIATVVVVALYVLATALDVRPATMFVGLSPLSFIAAETAWHLIGDLLGDVA